MSLRQIRLWRDPHTGRRYLFTDVWAGVPGYVVLYEDNPLRALLYSAGRLGQRVEDARAGR